MGHYFLTAFFTSPEALAIHFRERNFLTVPCKHGDFFPPSVVLPLWLFNVWRTCHFLSVQMITKVQRPVWRFLHPSFIPWTLWPLIPIALLLETLPIILCYSSYISCWFLCPEALLCSLWTSQCHPDLIPSSWDLVPFISQNSLLWWLQRCAMMFGKQLSSVFQWGQVLDTDANRKDGFLGSVWERYRFHIKRTRFKSSQHYL